MYFCNYYYKHLNLVAGCLDTAGSVCKQAIYCTDSVNGVLGSFGQYNGLPVHYNITNMLQNWYRLLLQ